MRDLLAPARNKAKRWLSTVTGAPAPTPEVEQLRKRVQTLENRANRQANRLSELESEIQEQRHLNRRLAELTDVVQELLVPAVDRDDEKVAALLDPSAREN